MSFTGDVAGIGLADLLQSLARGREGVLTLNVRDGLRATLGVQDGQLHFLPDPGEDPESWRDRVRQAWVKDPDFRIDALRMTDIARAHRVENLYRLLDGDQVHFRFEPGPVPQQSAESALSADNPGTEGEGPRRDAVYCAPTSVEGFLLEYARLKDEFASANIGFILPEFALLAPMAYVAEGDWGRMFEELDGVSTVGEVADRLGWPLRQLATLASVALVNGAVRVLGADEALQLALQELVQGNTARAGTRLRAWLLASPSGPLSEADAGTLVTEWQAERLQGVLRELPRSEARALLRRMQLTLGSAATACVHWAEFLRIHPGDRLGSVSLLFAQIRAAIDPKTPALSEIAAQARAFQQVGRRNRAAVLWRVAATREAETVEQRLEIGLGLLDCSTPTEGVPLIVEACGALIERGEAEITVQPLRRALEIDPSNRDARRLLSRARAKVVQRTITRKNSLVTIAVVLLLAAAAIVTFQRQRAQEREFGEITALVSEPRQALKLLEERFPDDPSARVRELRASLLARCAAEDIAARSRWTDHYREAQLECTIGDPKLGLARALELPAPPKLADPNDALPIVSDLFNGLAARLENTLKEIGPDVRDQAEQIQAEERLASLSVELRGAVQQNAAHAAEAKEFLQRLDAMEKKIGERQERRKSTRTVKSQRDNLQRQDMLLATARSHAQANDYARSREAYDKLLQSDESGRLAVLLKKEIDKVTEKSGAVDRARDLARAGKHAEALELLRATVDSPDSFQLPWKLETVPPGARAHMKDGQVKSTPLSYDSSFEESFDAQLELDGYEKATLHVDGPKDRKVFLSRIPERAWAAGGRVEALPVISGDDHVVCDRAGNVARLARDGRAAWSKKLSSLSGVARSPLFLPGRPGHLLLLSEDGEAWIVDAQTGELEGPQALPSPPLDGPALTEDGVVARLRDGSLALWTSTPTAEVVAAREFGSEHAAVQKALAEIGPFGTRLDLAVLRRRTDRGTQLDSPWSNWTVDIQDEIYAIHERGSAPKSFPVRRQGEWSYIAWEAPRGSATNGRVWIADESGLRSFTP